MFRTTLVAFTLLNASILAAVGQGVGADALPDSAFTPQSASYSTGTTAISQRPLRKLAATAVPPSLSLHATAQSKLSSAVAGNLKLQALGARQQSTLLEDCDPKADQFNWVAKGAVTPVKDQGDCGDCFIFAATGAFESSWYLQHGQKITVSEQQILDCASSANCVGGWHGDIFDFLRTRGVTTDSAIPYLGHSKGLSADQCNIMDSPFSAVNWGYVDASGATASPAAIKAALCTHGPVAAAVNATVEFHNYVGGVFNEFTEGNGSSEVNHAILIVGWDDDKDAWLIKNSWGTQGWGENGYMWIRYRSNNIGFGAAWVDAVKIPGAIAVVPPPAAPVLSALASSQPAHKPSAAEVARLSASRQATITAANKAKYAAQALTRNEARNVAGDLEKRLLLPRASVDRILKLN